MTATSTASTGAAVGGAAASDAGQAGLTAAGAAENAQTVATMIASIHIQGEAARTNAMGEAAKAEGTIHD